MLRGYSQEKVKQNIADIKKAMKPMKIGSAARRYAQADLKYWESLLIKKNPAPKRKTAARTQKAAESYIRRPLQITKVAPSKRLKKRRTINLQTPRGVFPNPAKRKPKYPGSMDVAYPTLAAFKKDAKGAGYDADELLMSGQYFVESDGHVLSKDFYPKTRTNPALRKKEITVEQSLDKKHWTIFARFPDTPDGSKDAIEYAKAYAKKEPYLHIRVMTK